MSATAPLEIALPEPMLRPSRFGPFASVTDALKFLLALAVGAIAAALTAPLTWLPFVGGGFLLATYRPDGKSIDERCGDWLRWRFRSLGGRRLGRAAASPGPLLALDGGLYAGLDVASVPLAYLPTAEQAGRFAAYRSLLDGLSGPVWMEIGSERVRPGPYLPPRPAGLRPEETGAFGAYREMLDLLLKRRCRRRVRVLLAEGGTGRVHQRRLSSHVGRLAEAFGGVGLDSRRLRASELAALLGPAPEGAA
ncbi:MAG TPA: hypothetical protein VGU43_06540 [Thermoplasmata archaeon]|nr:hypothetical protein [Thermoplasmata archaeon]